MLCAIFSQILISLYCYIYVAKGLFSVMFMTDTSNFNIFKTDYMKYSSINRILIKVVRRLALSKNTTAYLFEQRSFLKRNTLNILENEPGLFSNTERNSVNKFI